jgi:alpha-tubulin suppressor-like RCC1 family protein
MDIGGPASGANAVPAGTPLYLYIAPQLSSTPVTTKVDKVGAACAVKSGNHPAGQVVVIGVYSGTTKIGTVAYAHVVPDASLPSPGQPINRWGSLIGTVGGGYAIPNGCWTGVHLHIEMGNMHNYSCFNGGFHAGKPWGDAIYRTNFVGFLGGQRTTSSRQPCPSSAGHSAMAISAGSAYACAVKSGGDVKCWGDNLKGELGNGTTTASKVPVQVSGLTSGVTAIGAGFFHTCALTTGGAVKCWGDNSYGQLGNGTFTSSAVAVQVSGLTSGVTAISVGEDHTCAITSSGAAKCWGDNSDGALGNGTYTTSALPVQVSGLTTGVTAISAGSGYNASFPTSNFTCAIAAGAAKCWGRGENGELGHGTATFSSTMPVQVTGLTSSVKAISAGGAHACAIVSTGAAKCWGSNSDGELGNGTNTDSAVPVQVSRLTSGVRAITADESPFGSQPGTNHSCAITSTGGATCWGTNLDGELGNGTSTDSRVPVSVSGLTSVTSISAGSQATCAVAAGGTAICWGWNGSGNLGNGTTSRSNVPVSVVGL